MKAIERLIEVLPVPALIAAALVCLVAWLTKETKSLPTWGATFRDTHFQVATFLVSLSLVGYYGVTTIWRRHVPREVGKEHVYVAQFDGDGDNSVQKHTLESLQTALLESDDCKHVSVLPYKQTVRSFSNVKGSDLSRICLVYGTFIAPKTVHYKFCCADDEFERRHLETGYPDIPNLLAKIVEVVGNRLQNPVPEDKGLAAVLLQLRGENDSLRDELELQRRQLRRLEVQSGTDAPLRTARTKVVDYYSRQKKHVLCIGINSYRVLPSLSLTVKDAHAVASTFKDMFGDNVSTTMLLDEQASKARVMESLNQISAQAKPEDQVIVFYSGHGLTKNNVGYLVPSDADPDSLESSAISMLAFGDAFKQIPAKQKVMLVDACYSGAFDVLSAKGVESISTLENYLAGEGEVVISAGTSTQLVAENIEIGYGLFTYHLVNGLRGQSDQNGNGLITISELFAYVRSQLRRATENSGMLQTPAMHARGLTDFVVGIVDGSSDQLEPSSELNVR